MKSIRLRGIYLLLQFFFQLLLSIPAGAEVTLPSLLADHMVVQRGLPVHVWGMASAHESVSVTFRDETRSTSTDDSADGVFIYPLAKRAARFRCRSKRRTRSR